MKSISKKLLSILVAFCLLASIALPAGILSGAAQTTELIAYADLANGNDETAVIGDASKPYLTLAAAMEAIDAAETTAKRVVQFVGTHDGNLATHTNMITLRGTGSSTSVLSAASFSFYGPTRLENLKVSAGEAWIATNYGDVEIGENVMSSYFHLLTGNRWNLNEAPNRVQKITIDGSNVYSMYLAGNPADNVKDYYGADFVFNAGNFIRLHIAGHTGGANFKGNVNATINKALMTHNNSGVFLNATGKETRFNGNALQLIYNNDSKSSAATKSGDYYPTVESVAALGGVFYELVVARNDLGSTLSTTETAGTYKVNNAGVFSAVAYDATGNKVATSTADGYLTVPGAGNYTVAWEEIGGETVTEIDFSTGSAWCLGFYTGVEATAETPYVLSFDYYLPTGSGSVGSESIGTHASITSGSMKFEPGHHTVYTEWKTNNANKYFVPKLNCSDTNTKLYIWNYRVTVGGSNGNNNGSINSSWRTATKTEVGKLKDQPWYAYMDDPIVTEVTFVDDNNNDGASNYSPTTPWYFGGTDEQNKYTVSFDYYLPKTVGGMRFFSVSQNMSNSAPAMDYTAGIHHYEWETYSTMENGRFVTAIESVYGAQMYIWNWSVKINGVEIAGQANSGWNGQTNGTLGKALSQYSWANPDAPAQKTVTSIEIATPPTKTVYENGETLDTTGLSVKVNYSDETFETITEGFTLSGFDSTVAGDKTITVTYEDKTAEFTVTVNEVDLSEALVTEIDFSTGSAWCLGFYTGVEATAETPYILSFDYYLPTGSGSVGSECIGAHASITSGSMKFEPGHHTVYTEWKTNNANKYFVPKLNCSDTNTKLYIWNYRVTVGGSNGNDNGSIGASWRTATKTEVGKLKDQPWYAYMDAPIVTEVIFPENGDAATSKWSPDGYFYFGGDSVENAYEISFEYFLYDEIGSVNFDSVSGHMNTIEGTRTLSAEAGYHKVYWKTWTEKAQGSLTGQFVPYIEAPVGSKMYIWNWSVKIKGQEIKTNNIGGWSSNTTGTTGQPLTTYEWYEGMENWHGDPTNPLVTAVDLSAGNKWYIGEYRDSEGVHDEYVWDLEFEYFLPERIDINFSNGPGYSTILEGSPKIEVGHHTIKLKIRVQKYVPADEETGTSASGAYANAFIPIFANNSAHDSTLYVWNMKVKLNGEDYKLNKFNETPDYPQAPLDMSKKLKDYEWHTDMDDVVDTTPPDVVAVDFSKGERWTHTIVRAKTYTHDTPYVISFDYYLPTEYADVPLVLDSVAGGHRLLGGDAPYFVTGHHKFHAIYRTGATSNTFAPFLLDKSMSAKIYIWNFKIMTGNTEVLYSTGGEVTSYCSAGVDISKRLNEYDWYEGMDDVPVVENKTQDSQYMVKIDNYFYDVETSQTLKDQEFRQLVGVANSNQTGTLIKPNTTYIFSFDYYSAENLGSTLRVWQMFTGDGGKSGTSFKDPQTGEGVGKQLEYEGRYHVETEITTWPNQYDLSVGIGIGSDGVGYYWNFSLVEKDTGKELLRNTALVQPKRIAESGKTVGDWISNDVTKEFPGNVNWISIDSDEAKAILALKEGEVLPSNEVVEEEEEEEEEKTEQKPVKDNPLGPDTLYNPDFDIAMDYADGSGFGVGYSLDIYEYLDGQLAETILEKIGNKRYKAFDIQLVYDDQFIQPDKEIFLAVYLPDGFDPDLTKVYYCDAYGTMTDVGAYVDGEYLLFQNAVLGTFVIVDGGDEDGTEQDPLDEPTDTDEPSDTDEPADGDEPSDTDEPTDTKPNNKNDKNNKKDTKSDNSWILWVAIVGGALLLAAAGVVTALVLKKKKSVKAAE